MLDFTDRKEFRSGDRRKPSCLPNRVRNFDNELHSPTPPQIVPACPPAKGESKRRVFQGAGWHLGPCAAHFRFTSQLFNAALEISCQARTVRSSVLRAEAPSCIRNQSIVTAALELQRPGEALRGWRPGNSYVFRDVQQLTQLWEWLASSHGASSPRRCPVADSHEFEHRKGPDGI